MFHGITVIENNVTQAAFKNCAPFIMCITENNVAITDDPEDLDLVMLMYNLLEYNLNQSDTTDSLWFYCRDEATNFNADIGDCNAFRSFSYKAK